MGSTAADQLERPAVDAQSDPRPMTAATSSRLDYGNPVYARPAIARKKGAVSDRFRSRLKARVEGADV